MTGVGTQVGIAIGESNIAFALELFGFPLFFILGAFVSGAVTVARIERGLPPHFDRVTLLLPAGLVSLIYLGQSGFFGPFGEQLTFTRDFVVLYLLSFLCGLQNGCFATLTKGQIRTTHLTGISTDLGTDMARLWLGQLKGEERGLTLRTQIARILTFASFGLGSVSSVLICRKLEYAGLLLPLVTSICVAILVRIDSLELDRKYGLTSQNLSTV